MTKSIIVTKLLTKQILYTSSNEATCWPQRCSCPDRACKGHCNLPDRRSSSGSPVNCKCQGVHDFPRGKRKYSSPWACETPIVRCTEPSRCLVYPLDRLVLRIYKHKRTFISESFYLIDCIHLPVYVWILFADYAQSGCSQSRASSTTQWIYQEETVKTVTSLGANSHSLWKSLLILPSMLVEANSPVQ